jgi:hypothetical protein
MTLKLVLDVKWVCHNSRQHEAKPSLPHSIQKQARKKQKQSKAASSWLRLVIRPPAFAATHIFT